MIKENCPLKDKNEASEILKVKNEVLKERGLAVIL